MQDMKVHRIISIILLVLSLVFLRIGFVNPFYSIAVVQFAPLIFFGVGMLMLSRPHQLPSVIGVFTSIYFYILKSVPRRRVLDEIPPIEGNPFVDATILHPIRGLLENFGLQPIGAFISKNGLGKGIDGLIWVYADETQTFFAEICAYKNNMYGVEIRSEYPDGFLLGTVYNLPIDMESERFYVRSFETLPEALDYHQYQTSVHAAKHGEPLRFDTIEAYIGTGEKEVAENKALAWDGGIAHLRAARWTILTLALIFVVPIFLPRFFMAVGVALLITGIAFWIEDFFIPRQPVAQMMEQRKKQKALQQ